jgi:hypothetical protein
MAVLGASWKFEEMSNQSQYKKSIRNEIFKNTIFSGGVLVLKMYAGMVTHTCNPSYTGGVGKGIVFQGWPGKKDELFPEK